ncbi:MAG: HAD family hydrolase [Bariatricus sp.]
MIRGVLFDMDGLMFDTERIGYEGWKYAGEKLGIDMPDELIASFRGTGETEKRRYFKEVTGRQEQYDEAHMLRTAYADEWIEKNGLPVKAGLEELLKYLKAKRIPAALATSSSREKAMRYLEMTGVQTYFTAAVCGNEVKRAKPAPDIFLTAAKALGVPAKECLVLEDSLNGLKAAKAAGCKAIVIPDLSPAPPKEDGLWDAKAVDLKEVISLMTSI